MKKCEELLANHERKTVGYLTTGGAYDAGFRVGFKMALGWALKLGNDVDTKRLKDYIREELGD